jgi:hypothetical protein
MRKQLLSLTTALCLAISFSTSVYATQVTDESQESTDGYVAQVGEEKFTSLNEALDSIADGQTITLLSDITGSFFAVFTSCTLDLNGHTIKADGTGASFIIGVFSEYSLTIKDSAGGGCIEYDGKATTETILNNGTLRICSGTIIGGDTAIHSVEGDASDACIIVEGGTIKSNRVAIHVQSGSLSVFGGTIQSGGTDIPAIDATKNAAVDISGGKIIGAVDSSFYSKFVYYEDITSFRQESGYTAPTQEGKVFCGWYDAESREYLTEAQANEATCAYAKFVDQDVLSLGRQITYNTTVDSDITDLRLVTTVDSNQYRTVGFTIQLGDGTIIERTFHTVYESISGKNGEIRTEYHPSDFSADSRYFLAFEIENIPKDAFDTNFTVTPFWITPDGTQVNGSSSSFTISDTIDELKNTQS